MSIEKSVFDTDFGGICTDVMPITGSIDSLIQADEAWNTAYCQRKADKLIPLLAEDWLGFFPNEKLVLKKDIMKRIPGDRHDALIFERHASLVYGNTGITRGTLYINGSLLYSFVRIWSWLGGEWRSVSLQVVPSKT